MSITLAGAIMLTTACGTVPSYVAPTACVTCDTATDACKRLYGQQYVASAAGGCTLSPYAPAD